MWLAELEKALDLGFKITIQARPFEDRLRELRVSKDNHMQYMTWDKLFWFRCVAPDRLLLADFRRLVANVEKQCG